MKQQKEFLASSAVDLNSIDDLFEKGQHEEAIGQLQDVVASSDDPYAYEYLGNAYFAVGQHDLALKNFDKAGELNKEVSWTLNSKGNDLFAEGKFDEAIEFYNAAIQVDSSNPWPYRNIGVSLLRKTEGETGEAFKHLDKAIDIDPTFLDPWYDKAAALLAQEQYDDAIKCYQRVLEITPDTILALQNIAIAKEEMQLFEEALEAYDKVLEINPDDGWTLVRKAYILKKIMKKPGTEQLFHLAEQSLSKVLDDALIDVDRSYYLNLLGLVKIELGDIKQAEEILREAVKLDNHNPFCHYNLALIYSVYHINLDQALASATTAHSLNKEDFGFTSTLIEILIQRREYEKARDVASEVLARKKGFKLQRTKLIARFFKYTTYVLTKEEGHARREFNDLIRRYEASSTPMPEWDFDSFQVAIAKQASNETRFQLLCVVDLLTGRIQPDQMTYFDDPSSTEMALS